MKSVTRINNYLISITVVKSYLMIRIKLCIISHKMANSANTVHSWSSSMVVWKMICKRRAKHSSNKHYHKCYKWCILLHKELLVTTGTSIVFQITICISSENPSQNTDNKIYFTKYLDITGKLCTEIKSLIQTWG